VAPPSGNVSRPGRALAALVVLAVLLFLVIVSGNAFQPASWGKDFKVRLGLDLTSGTTVSLKAQTPKGGTPKQSLMAQAVSIMDSRVNSAGFTGARVQQQGSDVITVAVPGKGSQQVVNLVGQTAQLRFRQVLLEAPNSAAAATPTPAPSASASSAASPTPSASPSASSSAHAAGEPGSAGAAAGTREMASRARALPAASASPSASTSASPSASTSATPTPAPTSGLSTVADAQGDASLVSPHVQALFNKLNCADKNWKQGVGYTQEQFDNPNVQIVGCDSSGIKYALDKAKVLGSMITSASATLSSSSINWQTNLTFNSAGTAAFGQLTSQMYSKYGTSGTASSPLDLLAIVLDGNVISPSAIDQGAITGGQAQITGNFTQSQATQLANVLSYGALPLTFTKQSVDFISPQLGHDQLTAGLIAGGIGLILVVLYCLLYYRGLALVAVSSLLIAGILVFESVIVLGKLQGLSLNLAGVAGLIVAIGITADSFVVFFERLRDEVREGRTLRTAVERGWKRARRTILVSDTVSFLAAALLFFFSVDEVKGFAFTLGLTTIIDVVVVFLFTKPMLTLLARTKFYGQGHPLSGLDPVRLGARAPWRAPGRTPGRASGRTPRVPAGSPAKEA
jgi:preprotein translocase subunit SecD